MVWSLIRLPSELVVVLMTGASAVTVTSCVEVPTCTVAFDVSSSATFRVSPVIVCVWKPWASTFTE